MSTIPKDNLDKIDVEAEALCQCGMTIIQCSNKRHFKQGAEFGYQLATDGREELEKELIHHNTTINNLQNDLMERVKQITALQSSLSEKEDSIIEKDFIIKDLQTEARFLNENADNLMDQVYNLKSSLKEKEKECEELKRASHDLAKICEGKMGQNLNLCLQIVGLKEILKRCRDVIDMECDDHEFIIEIDNNLNQVL